MDEILEARDAIQNADAILISAGAGMGVDSGLPDFRGNEGFWKAYPFAKKHGLSFSSMANPEWFAIDARTAWAFYGHRLNLYRETVPHQGFTDLLQYCQDNDKSHFVFTSNVDGQFQKAGFAADNILECHGSIHALQCSAPCSDRVWPADDANIEVDFEAFQAVGDLPRCQCGAVARPNILMFGDWQWVADAVDAQHQRFERWLHSLRTSSANLVVIEMGAGTAVPTVRYTSEKVSAGFDGPLVRINVREAHGPDHCISISMGAQAAVASILNA